MPKQMQAPSALEDFVTNLKNHKPLSDTEQRDLARTYRAGGPDAVAARELLITSNLRFAMMLARQKFNGNVELEELLSAAYEGLCVAADRYDPDMESKFSSYASVWIDQRISLTVGLTHNPVRIRGHNLQNLRAVTMARESLKSDLRREPTIQEVATACDLSVAVTYGLLFASEVESRLDWLTSDKDRPNQLASPETHDITWHITLNTALEKLPEREAYILREYHGLNGGGDVTLDTIAETLGITRERVRQLKDRAHKHLKEMGDLEDLDY
jgi:RNA polymerase primary sigma factor